MKTIKLTIAYDGSGYSGWQIQPNGLTIQELIQKAVRGMTGEENNVVGAGRTDAGVHAFAQVASFKTEKEIPLDGFRKGLNSSLPKDIRIIDIEEVGDTFHPIRDSKSKHYRYLISVGEYEHPLYLNRSWCLRRELDLDAMHVAAEHLVGEHDFSAFRASDDCNENAVREVFSVGLGECNDGWRGAGFRGQQRKRCPQEGPEATGPVGMHFINNIYYAFDIVGSGFLKNMVRNIVGTLVDVGLGKTTPEQFKEILDSKDRKKAGVCAPALGLYLMHVEY